MTQAVHAKPPTTRPASTAQTGPLPPGQLVILVALTFWLYGSTLTHLVKQWWHDPNFSHGFFVPAFSAFVVWQRRSHWAQIPLKPSWTVLESWRWRWPSSSLDKPASSFFWHDSRYSCWCAA